MPLDSEIGLRFTGKNYFEDGSNRRPATVARLETEIRNVNSGIDGIVAAAFEPSFARCDSMAQIALAKRMREVEPIAMDTPTLNRLEAVFAGAAELPTGDRAAWLDVECAGQPELRAEVEELLRSHEAGGIMQNPEIERELARLKPEEPGDQIGPYKLLQEMGEGGFGTVWVADQEHPVRRRVEPGFARAEASAKLCDELFAAPLSEQGNLIRESLAKLHLATQNQQRPAAELMPVARLLGDQKNQPYPDPEGPDGFAWAKLTDFQSEWSQ